MTPTGIAGPQRTDPRSFAANGVTTLGKLALPVGIGALTILDDGDLSDVAMYFVPLVVVVVGLNLALAYLQWTRLTYEVRESDIRVESGLLSRAARAVPFERIQDVSLEQKFIPRLFGLIEVKFETGAGGGDDLRLTYLSEHEGERLRELVRARRDGQAEDTALPPKETEADGEPLFTMPPQRVVTFGMFEFSLAVVAIVGGLAQQFEFLLPFDFWDVDMWQEQLAGQGQWLSGLGPLAQAIGIAIAIGSLAVLGVATGLIRTTLREWDFRLERTDKGLRRRRGLLTRTDVVMPLHRVQALKLTTGIVRRLFGWYGLSVVSLASDSAAANHSAAPFAQLDEIEPVARTTGFALPSEDMNWHCRSGKACFDSALISVVTLTMVTIIVWVLSPAWWSALIPFAFAILAAAREYYLYRFDRHALTDHFLYARHGWLSPKTTIGSRSRLQSVEIRQHPLARWRGYARLELGLAGGTFVVEAMDIGEAIRWREAILASIAETDFSELIAAPQKSEFSGA